MQGTVAPAAPSDMRGGREPSSALHPCEGPHLRCTPLHSPKWEHSSHALRREGAPPLRPRVTFPSRGKSPKARQGLRPLESPGAWSPPFSRSLTHRAGLPSDTTKDRFATLRWWANRSCFSFGFIKGTLCVFNPWRGRFLTPEDAASLFTRNQYR